MSGALGLNPALLLLVDRLGRFHPGGRAEGGTTVRTGGGRSAGQERGADRATQDLLRELRAGPTDLAKLVGAVVRRQPATVAVEADALARWNRDAARHWQLVQAWLAARGVRVTVVS